MPPYSSNQTNTKEQGQNQEQEQEQPGDFTLDLSTLPKAVLCRLIQESVMKDTSPEKIIVSWLKKYLEESKKT
jgi:hypothetical protein